MIRTGDRTAIGSMFTEFAEALLSAGRYDEAAGVARRGLDHLQGDLSADRMRLLSVLGRGGVSAEPVEETSREALNLASTAL